VDSATSTFSDKAGPHNRIRRGRAVATGLCFGDVSVMTLGDPTRLLLDESGQDAVMGSWLGLSGSSHGPPLLWEPT